MHLKSVENMTAWSDEQGLIDRDGEEAYGREEFMPFNISIKPLRTEEARKETKRKEGTHRYSNL